MSRPSIRVVLSDNDGCLSSEAGGRFDLEAFARISERNRRARAGGEIPELTVCTGRPLMFVEALCRCLDIQLPAIAESGVWIWDPIRQVAEMDPRIGQAERDGIREALNYCERDLVPDGFELRPGKACSLTLWSRDRERLFSRAAELQARVDGEGWPLVITLSEEHLNFDLARVDKGTGIQRFREITGLSVGDLGAIGDTGGDLKMRPEVSWFGCPANAIPSVKGQADFVAAGPELAGMHELLEHLDGAPLSSD
ncbi:MAG: HAD hydrolase family protein [Planctomycetota bacterium]